MPAGRRLFESLTILLLSAVGLFLQAVPLWASVLLSSTLVAWTVASWQSLEKVLAKSYPRRMVGRVISIFGIIAGTSFAAGSLVTRGLESAVHQDRIGWLVTFLGCALLCVPIAIFERTKGHMRKRLPRQALSRTQGIGSALVVTGAFLGMGGEEPAFFLIVVAAVCRLIAGSLKSRRTRARVAAKFLQYLDRTEEQVWMTFSASSRSKGAAVVVASMVVGLLVLGFNLRFLQPSYPQILSMGALGAIEVVAYGVLRMRRIPSFVSGALALGVLGVFVVLTAIPSTQPLSEVVRSVYPGPPELAQNAIFATPWFGTMLGVAYLGLWGSFLVQGYFARSSPRDVPGTREDVATDDFRRAVSCAIDLCAFTVAASIPLSLIPPELVGADQFASIAGTMLAGVVLLLAVTRWASRSGLANLRRLRASTRFGADPESVVKHLAKVRGMLIIAVVTAAFAGSVAVSQLAHPSDFFVRGDIFQRVEGCSEACVSVARSPILVSSWLKVEVRLKSNDSLVLSVIEPNLGYESPNASGEGAGIIIDLSLHDMAPGTYYLKTRFRDEDGDGWLNVSLQILRSPRWPYVFSPVHPTILASLVLVAWPSSVGVLERESRGANQSTPFRRT